MEAVDILPAAVDTCPIFFGVAFAGPLSGSCLFGDEPLHWGPCCLVPCRVPFAENDDCFAADNLPAVDIVATAGGFASVPAIAVDVPLVMPTIYLGGPKAARLYYCYSEVPIFVALVCALGVVAASS